jgi:hypothetical protein
MILSYQPCLRAIRKLGERTAVRASTASRANVNLNILSRLATARIAGCATATRLGSVHRVALELRK